MRAEAIAPESLVSVANVLAAILYQNAASLNSFILNRQKDGIVYSFIGDNWGAEWDKLIAAKENGITGELPEYVADYMAANGITPEALAAALTDLEILEAMPDPETAVVPDHIVICQSFGLDAAYGMTGYEPPPEPEPEPEAI